jgi:hypothetical protein
MKHIKYTIIALALLLLAIVCYDARAQKLPNKQETGLRAPANVKIDGKATEWGNKFQAHNDATGVFYTMANDDGYLYLVMQTSDIVIVDKIVGLGATLTIQKNGKANSKDAISITYPLNNGLIFNTSRNRVALRDTSSRTSDSLSVMYNNLLAAQCKTIGVKGIAGIDTAISVYNEDGIKGACLFNNKRVYTYELAISLKNLGLNAADATTFAYHLKLNGKKMPVISNSGTIMVMNSNGQITKRPMTPEDEVGLQELTQRMAMRDGPTDFWGEYTLVK